jgi:hypothetical protein
MLSFPDFKDSAAFGKVASHNRARRDYFFTQYLFALFFRKQSNRCLIGRWLVAGASRLVRVAALGIDGDGITQGLIPTM